MAKRKRGRSTGRYESGEHFAAIPVEVMHSAPYGALPDYAVRVLLALAAKYRGRNNGNLSLTGEEAAALGVKAKWKVRAGLELLRNVGLVERTREGKYGSGRGICALFAITWKTINITPAAFPPIDNERPAPNTWAKWERPVNWREYEAAIRRTAQGSNATWETAAHDRTRRLDLARTKRLDLENGESDTTRTRRPDLEAPVSRTRRLGDLLDSGREVHVNGKVRA